jgi:formylglycine-generating enzyme required for sulfatase activity
VFSKSKKKNLASLSLQSSSLKKPKYSPQSSVIYKNLLFLKEKNMRNLFFAALLLFTVYSCHNPSAENNAESEAKPDKAKIEKLLEFVKVEGGTFTMGDENLSDATPHEVEVSSFYIQKTEVTQELWEAVMGSNPSQNKSWKDNPVTNVSWDDCQAFIKKLNSISGKKCRLPSEAEWEYAARGGKQSKGYKYAGSDNLDEVAWHGGNSNQKIHPVAEKKPNELGLYDMTGNVWEWCNDWYGDYRVKFIKNPQGPDNGTYRVLRGGTLYHYAVDCLVADRGSGDPDFGSNYLGFRLLSPVE